jgi:hypothetical protein
MKFRDIKQYPFAGYHVNVSWNYLEEWLDQHEKDIMKLDMDPEYQRGYVWDEYQKVSYVENQLRGGFSGKDIFWNCPTWMHFNAKMNIIELVDGKQRISAVLDFLHGKIKAFGLYIHEFEDVIPHMNPAFSFHVNNLKSRKDIVEWYLGMNTGGSIHTEEDLKPAREMLAKIDKEKHEN